jgi:Spy/CpxP family protein refolding chaperone
MLRKSLVPCVAIVALSFLVVGQQAQAQGRRGGGFMRGPQGVNDLAIAGNEAVKKELNLKPEQADKLKDLTEDVGEELRSQMGAAGFTGGGGQDLSPEERAKRASEMQAKMTEIRKGINEKFMPKLAEILDKGQLKRVHEIAIQSAGPHALLDATVQKDLGLTAEQKDKLTAINKDFAKTLAEVPRAERMAKMHELNEEQLAKSTEVLTKDQQTQFASLKGKPFDLKALRPAGGGRRARTGAGGGNN